MGDAVDLFGLVGDVVERRYAVERVVARGGFGLVYRATHVELGAAVALKVLVVPPHLRGAEGELVEQFRREARTLAAVHHPAIVRVLDVGGLERDGQRLVWMALEWLDGVTFADDLNARQGRRRSPAETLALLAPALDALALAHARGVAHRDLKPANLMLVADARGGVCARVLDFGIAKEFRPDAQPGTGDTDTQSALSAFSLDHAAPEQIGRLRTGPWTDVHALGLLVIEALVGRRPYGGVETFDLYAAVMAAERPTPARLGLDVGPWEPVLRKALALKPADRYANAAELRDALTASVDAAERAWKVPAVTATEPAGRNTLAPVEATPIPDAPAIAAPAIVTPTPTARPRARVTAAVVAGFALLALGARFARGERSRVATTRPVVLVEGVARGALTRTAAPAEDAASTATASASSTVPAPMPAMTTPAVTTLAVTTSVAPPPRVRRARPRAASAGDPEVVME